VVRSGRDGLMAVREAATFLQRRGGLATVVLLCVMVVGSIAATCVRGPAGVGTSTPPTESTPGPTETPVATLIGTVSATTTQANPLPTSTRKPTWTPVTDEGCLTPIPVPTVEIRTLPDGGLAYWYDTDGDGLGDTYIAEPPANFDALTASERELTFYGIPPRPDDPDQLSVWIPHLPVSWQGWGQRISITNVPCLSAR
jgi:hypothetical protein